MTDAGAKQMSQTNEHIVHVLFCVALCRHDVTLAAMRCTNIDNNSDGDFFVGKPVPLKIFFSNFLFQIKITQIIFYAIKKYIFFLWT